MEWIISFMFIGYIFFIMAFKLAKCWKCCFLQEEKEKKKDSSTHSW